MKNRKWFINILGIGVSCVIMFSGCAEKQTAPLQSSEEQSVLSSSEEEESSPQHADSEQEGLKSFTAVALDGSTMTQEDIAKNDVTVFHFWATTCGPCIVEMPELAEFAKSLPENVQLITVCFDGAMDMDGAKSIVEEAGYEGITLIAGDGDFQNVCAGILYTPTTITVNQNGDVVGDPIIGSQKDLAKTYTAAINNVLQSMGKAEIGNENNEG